MISNIKQAGRSLTKPPAAKNSQPNFVKTEADNEAPKPFPDQPKDNFGKKIEAVSKSYRQFHGGK